MFFAEGRLAESFIFQARGLGGDGHDSQRPKRQTLEYFFGALPCSSERQSELLNNLGRALWKLNNSLRRDEVSSQLGVPLVDSLLDNSIAWQAGGGKESRGDEYVSVRGGSSRPHSAHFNYISHGLSEKRIRHRLPISRLTGLHSPCPTRDSHSVAATQPQRTPGAGHLTGRGKKEKRADS